jgi:hypothetical protein
LKHKSIVKIAAVMIVAFGLMVVAYPLLFGPNQTPLPEPTVAPLMHEIAH